MLLYLHIRVALSDELADAERGEGGRHRPLVLNPGEAIHGCVT